MLAARVEQPDPATQWRALAPVIAGQPRVRESRDGGRNYPAKWERSLHDDLPRVPAAVRLYGPDGTLRCLAADFDVSRGGQPQVDTDAAAMAQLVAACGGDVIADQSPNGGRHLYLPLQDAVAFPDVQRLARALAARFPSLDPTPLLNLVGGCIRPPGARHKSGGHQLLTTPFQAAVRLARTPNPPTVWAKLVDALTPFAQPTAGTLAEPDWHRLDLEPVQTGRWASLPAVLSAIARTGQHDYRSDSEARQAVLTSAAARGWPLLEVARRVELGTWAGLASFYARYPARHRRQALLRDWRKAVAFTTSRQAVPKSHTSDPTSQGALGKGRPEGSDEHLFLREWRTALDTLEAERYGDQRAGITRRLLLRALAEAAHKRGSRHIAFGTRSLALAAGVDHSTVARHLRYLADEDDPFLVLLENDRGVRGDLYELTIPQAAGRRPSTRDLPAGKVYALRPVFRELGAVAALVYEGLERSREQATRHDLAADVHLSPSATAAALRTLGAYGLAVRQARGWALGAASLNALAEHFGIPEQLATLRTRYAVERAAWRAILGAVELTVPQIIAAPRSQAPPQTAPPPAEEQRALTLLQQILGARVIANYERRPTTTGSAVTAGG